MSLPFDILVQIVLQCDHNTLLSLRASCNEVKDFVTPLAFRDLCVQSDLEGFERLEEFGTKGQTLSALVLNLRVAQAEDIDVTATSHFATLQIQFEIASHLHLLLPNLESITILFPADVDMLGSDNPLLIQDAALRNFCNPSIKHRHLRRFEVLHIAGSVVQSHFLYTSFFSSLETFSITNKEQHIIPSAYFPFSRSLDHALQSLSPQRLTTLHIGTSDISQPAPYIDPDLYFPYLTTLSVMGFQIEDSTRTSTLAALIVRHRTSLLDLTLPRCWLLVPYICVAEEERVQAWASEAGLTTQYNRGLRRLKQEMGNIPIPTR